MTQLVVFTVPIMSYCKFKCIIPIASFHSFALYPGFQHSRYLKCFHLNVWSLVPMVECCYMVYFFGKSPYAILSLNPYFDTALYYILFQLKNHSLRELLRSFNWENNGKQFNWEIL